MMMKMMIPDRFRDIRIGIVGITALKICVVRTMYQLFYDFVIKPAFIYFLTFIECDMYDEMVREGTEV